MISTGDLKNQAEELRKNMKKLKYSNNITVKQFQTENPQVFLQLLHYVLVDYSEEFYKQMLDKQYDLFSKSDLRFMETVYKILVKEFKYKPQVTLNQFFQIQQYLEQKFILTNEVFQLVQDHCQKFDKQKPILKANKQDLSAITEIQSQFNEEESEEIEQNQNYPIPAPIPKDNKIENNQNQPDSILSDISTTLNKMNNFESYFEQNMQIKDDLKQTQGQLNTLQNQVQKPQQNLFTNQSNSLFQNNIFAQISPNQSSPQIQQNNNILKQQQKEQQQANNFQIPHQVPQQLFPTQMEFNQVQFQQFQNFMMQNQIQYQQQKPQEYVTRQEMNQITEMIKIMNNNVQQMVGKFDTLQSGVGKWVNNVNAQLVLLDNQVKGLKAQNQHNNDN